MTSISAGTTDLTEDMGEKASPHWTETIGSVLLVRRPDVPGIRFNPEDSNVLKTDEDRVNAQVALNALHQQLDARAGQPAEWYEALP